MTPRRDPQAPFGQGRGNGTGGRRPRGFTVLEILIVIGILVAIAGLTLPPIFRELARREFDGMLERVRQAAAHCRTDAMDDGRPRLLVAVMDRGEWALCGETVAAEMVGSAVQGTDEANGEKAPARRVYGTMPLGYKVVTQASLDGPQDELGESREAAADGGRQQVAIGVFLPDGTVYAGDPAVLLGPMLGELQLAAKIRLNRWTGEAACDVFDPKPSEKDSNQPEKDKESGSAGEEGGEA